MIAAMNFVTLKDKEFRDKRCCCNVFESHGLDSIDDAPNVTEPRVGWRNFSANPMVSAGNDALSSRPLAASPAQTEMGLCRDFSGYIPGRYLLVIYK